MNIFNSDNASLLKTDFLDVLNDKNDALKKELILWLTNSASIKALSPGGDDDTIIITHPR